LCLFTHIAAGALVGGLSPHPYLAPVFGIGSHFVLDIIPHRDIESMRAEILLGVLTAVVLIAGGVVNAAVALGMIFAVLPDLENLLWKMGKLRDDQKMFPGHVRFVPHGREVGRGSIVLQAFLAASIIAYLVWRGA
jgi:hypothetical protein